MSKNVIIAQSGGPSTVINNSLRGIIDACKSYPGIFKKIYGAWHGIEGVLKEELIDLVDNIQQEILPLVKAIGAGNRKSKQRTITEQSGCSPDFRFKPKNGTQVQLIGADNQAPENFGQCALSRIGITCLD